VLDIEVGMFEKFLSQYVLVRDCEEWQTLKTAVLAQQSTNKQSMPCCISCGNKECSMQAGVCAKWKPVV
jgi:hypothetical protein